MEAEDLYYQCCDKIDKDIEVAESFLVGCIHYVFKEKGVKVSRQKIKDHLKISIFEPYLRELRFISCLGDDSMQALITSSLDMSCILKQVEIIHKHAIGADYDLIQQSTHANKAKRASRLLSEVSNMMKPQTKIRTDSSLFKEGV